MFHIKLATILFSVLFFTTTAFASEADELREKAKAMQREAAELAEHGHKDEAANLKRRAVEMIEEAEHLDQRHAEVMRLKRTLERIRQGEEHLEEKAGAGEILSVLRQAAEQIEMKLRELNHQPHHEDDAQHDEIAHRLEHMRIAVDHLHEAGLHDVAEHVAERAEATERELHEQHRHQEGDVIREIMKQLDEMRREMGRLRDEVNELRRTLKKPVLFQ